MDEFDQARILIKDEVLAILCGMCSQLRMVENIDRYIDVCYPALDTGARATVQRIASHLDVFAVQNTSYMNDQENRLALIYQLTRISLLEFPHWLEGYSRFLVDLERGSIVDARAA